MAKIGRLTKLKSAIKRLPSLTKMSRSSSSISCTDSTSSSSSKEVTLHAVYVGKSRRRYFLSSDILCHPLFQELVDRSSPSEGYDGSYGEVVVANCEVVLFEHLLWMIGCGGNTGAANASGSDEDGRLGSMQELVEFYTC